MINFLGYILLAETFSPSLKVVSPYTLGLGCNVGSMYIHESFPGSFVCVSHLLASSTEKCIVFFMVASSDFKLLV